MAGVPLICFLVSVRFVFFSLVGLGVCASSCIFSISVVSRPAFARAGIAVGFYLSNFTRLYSSYSV